MEHNCVQTGVNVRERTDCKKYVESFGIYAKTIRLDTINIE